MLSALRDFEPCDHRFDLVGTALRVLVIDLAILPSATASNLLAFLSIPKIFSNQLLKASEELLKTLLTIQVSEDAMRTNDDVLLVNEARAIAAEKWWSDWINPVRRVLRLAAILKLVVDAFHRANSKATFNRLARETEESERRSERISLQQNLARLLAKRAESKDDPPYKHIDGAYAVGSKSPESLVAEVEKRIEEIAGFRNVLARKLQEERDENESRLSELRDEICAMKALIEVKDAALLAAAERIHGQSEALTAAAGRSREKPCSRCRHPIADGAKHRFHPETGVIICSKCDDDIPF